MGARQCGCPLARVPASAGYPLTHLTRAPAIIVAIAGQASGFMKFADSRLKWLSWPYLFRRTGGEAVQKKLPDDQCARPLTDDDR